MMKLEDQVCALELSRKLKELNIKQESQFYWHEDQEKYYPSYGDPNLCLCSVNNLSAFTVAELGAMLPDGISTELYEKVYCCGPMEGHGEVTNYKYFQDINEANARAKMIIYLIENELFKVGHV